MIDLTHGLDINHAPKHYITFGQFDSRRFGLNLHERVATTPSEKEITTSIPYRQGVVDMSNIIGNRIYEQREISYVFYRFGVRKSVARDFQTTIENLLMGEFNEALNDSYEPDFHYVGKCAEVLVSDEYERNRLRIEVKFDLYPFKIDHHGESADLFDPFNFDLDALQDGLTFSPIFNDNTEAEPILIYNASQRSHVPVITTNGLGLTIEANGVRHWLETGVARQYANIRLKPGMNTFKLTRGGGHDGMVLMSFDWRKERI